MAMCAQWLWLKPSRRGSSGTPVGVGVRLSFQSDEFSHHHPFHLNHNSHRSTKQTKGKEACSSESGFLRRDFARGNIKESLHTESVLSKARPDPLQAYRKRTNSATQHSRIECRTNTHEHLQFTGGLALSVIRRGRLRSWEPFSECDTAREAAAVICLIYWPIKQDGGDLPCLYRSLAYWPYTLRY